MSSNPSKQIRVSTTGSSVEAHSFTGLLHICASVAQQYACVCISGEVKTPATLETLGNNY